jgi:serine/threonine-protein kinase
MIGTPAYMSPEQLSGRGAIDGRSDLYGLGVVAFELLAGRTPWDGAAARERILEPSVPAPSVRAWNSAVPERLDDILQTAMALEPEDRFATLADFGDAVAAVARDRSASPLQRRAAHARLPVSIAVLPLRNLSPEHDNAYLSEGLTEEVTAALGRSPAFRVCAATSARAFAERALDPRAAGERLGVQHLLTGSVRRSGEHVRVSVELVNAADGFQLWSERYDRSFKDIVAVQDEIAEAIAVSLAARADPVATPAALLSDATMVTRVVERVGSDVTSRSTPDRSRDPQAHELYLRGRFLWNRRTAARLVDAIRCFEEACVLEPQFALAHAGLAAARGMTALYGSAPPAAAMAGARSAAERALALDPACAEAHTALALVLAGHDWRWAEAEQHLHAASLWAPSDATPHQWLAAMCLLPKNRIDDALDAVGRALRRDPLSLTVKTTHASVLYCARRYREAVVAARDVTSLDPAFAPAHFFLGQALTLVGDHEDAVAACRRACELSPESAESLAVLCLALRRAGDLAGARAVRDDMLARASTAYVSKGQLALASLGVGEPKAALHQLEAAVEERATDLIWLGTRPVWDPLREHPRFESVLARLNLAS